MAAVQCNESANLMSELYFECLGSLDLLGALREVPFKLQPRRGGFSPAGRCLALLASQAQGCTRLTGWRGQLRHDSRVCHWLGGRAGPHASTLSRSLAATDARTIGVLRRQVLVPLSDQAWMMAQARGGPLLVDVDNKGLLAEGASYEGASYGPMNDGRQRRGYRLHVLSLENRWPLEMNLTGANEHGLGPGMVMFKRLMHRLSGGARRRVVIRGDSAYGCVRFIRWVQRYGCGYLVKGYNGSTGQKLWRQTQAARRRIPRPGRPDLLALECGPTTLTGMTRRQRADGRQRRQAVKVQVRRVVVYREDPLQLPEGQSPDCFFLITTLPEQAYDSASLLEAYLGRAGDVENIFNQLEQAFCITHLRSRRFWGNYTFLMLAMIAAILTQLIREEALGRELPIPAGLSQTLTAAKESGLRLRQDQSAGCILDEGCPGAYAPTFRAILRCSCQHRFRYAA